MQQCDYLLRQIEQLGRVLGKILADLLGLKEQGKAHQGLVFAVEQFRDELDLDLGKLISIPEEDFIETLTGLREWNADHLVTFADILLELAEGHAQTGEQERARDLYRRVLLLYRYLDQTEAVFSLERAYKKERILKLL